MQKVVCINVLSFGEKGSKDKFVEMEFPILNKYLEEGYDVVNMHQIAPSEQSIWVTLTFILHK